MASNGEKNHRHIHGNDDKKTHNKNTKECNMNRCRADDNIARVQFAIHDHKRIDDRKTYKSRKKI